MNRLVMVIWILIAGLFLVLLSSAYIVKETQAAIRLRFGEVVEDNIVAGLHWKVPVVDTVRKFDARLLTLDMPPERYLTVGKKFVLVDSFLKWRIESVNKYYKATSGDQLQALNLLSNLLNKGLRDEFASRSLQEVVSGEREQLMAVLIERLSTQGTQFGIQVVDVRVKGIELPEDLASNLYRRMATEREREARELRSQGRELAAGIEANADRQKVEIEAEAYREAEKVKGEGDAMAAAIYANAYEKDLEFYRFTKSLAAYKASFQKQNIWLMTPESEFFQYLHQSSVKGK